VEVLMMRMILAVGTFRDTVRRIMDIADILLGPH
jgi:hypothetical protein